VIFERTDMKQDKNDQSTKCELPQTKSISKRVHEHLKNKNDHITDADIRNATINPNENELEIKNENAPDNERNIENDDDKKKEETKVITPWDVIDKNAGE
jgi:hypothetical protein